MMQERVLTDDFEASVDAGGAVPWNSTDSIRQKLESARKDLLDLGLRNSLLNYRLLQARGVGVVDELSAEVFRILVRQGKAMSFLPAPDKVESTGLEQPEDPVPGTVAARHSDSRLQTGVSSSQLQSRLLATYHAARTSIEEQGINTLYLALGMLHWYESKDSSQVRKAPLLLIPVKLERSNATERFYLHYSGEDVGANPSLSEKMRWEFGIKMPDMGDVEDLVVVEFFRSIVEAIQSQPTWKVEADEITLGFFSFAKLLMYKDLDPDTWPEDQQPTADPTIRALLEETFHEQPSRYSDDARLDEYQEANALHFVLDADSSQTLAVLDMKAGRNLVIQGPPGTGKSQTITNIIAEALALGKSVLFVAEKLAALDVVKRRLDRVGLGDACLELHSHNTQKKALLQELQRTLELGKPRSIERAGDRAQLERARSTLNSYDTAMNTPVGATEVTPHAALGAILLLRQRHGEDGLERVDVPGMAQWSGATFRELETRVEDLQMQLSITGVPVDHPFWGAKRTVFVPTEYDSLRQKLQAAIDITHQLADAGDKLASVLSQDKPRTRADIVALFPTGWRFWSRWFGKDKAERASAQELIDSQYERVHALFTFLDMDEDDCSQARGSIFHVPLDAAIAIFKNWLNHASELQALASLNYLTAQCNGDGLGAIVTFAQESASAASSLVPTFRYSWYTSILERAYSEREELAHFNRVSHERSLQEFRQLDERLSGYNSTTLADAHWEHLPGTSGSGQLAVLKREFEKKTRHIPIRQLIIKAGRPIQAIKPVFMMSPLSIANYLPPGSLTFDLVVFDEASQVKPVDAFGALLRGRQIIVVGDSRQLPPTSFFDSLARGEEAEEESVTSDMESVLGLFSAQLAPQRMLRWHYRSRHESLIAVSNHAFYHDRLVVFPSPDAGREHTGLIYHHLPESSYDRGGTRANQLEAEAVADAVMEHARTSPDLSLGVAAFSVAQMQAVQDRLEILRREDSSCEAFFTTAHPHEGFFVKNLETIQGDERDVILISIGYGRTRDGYLAMSFGPLNGDGGERRLNVLITRARVRCEVFTNLTADDVNDEGRGAGVRALKLFLKYAQTGVLDIPLHTGGEFDSPFEEAVWDELSRRGHTVHKQVGSAGFRIDLAIVDADKPGRYLLGIECDGAAYHSALSARDRDRLRQAVLEGLGWRIHRIWSTDWFSDPDKEMLRLEKAIENAQEQLRQRTSVPVTSSPDEPRVMRHLRSDETSVAHPAGTPYRMASLAVNTYGNELHAVYKSTLANWIGRVVDVESPVHIHEVARRVTDAAGVKRIGSRIESAMLAACEHGVQTGSFTRRGDFLWRRDMVQPMVRDRSTLPTSSRKLELVAPEELEAAVQRVVEDSYGIEADQIPPGVCRLLGIRRSTDDMVTLINRVVQRLLQRKALISQGGYLALASHN